MKEKILRRFDLATGCIFSLVSIFFLIEGIKLFYNPFGKSVVSEEELESIFERWFESPALLPMVVSVLILLCSVGIVIHAYKKDARFDFLKKENFNKLMQNHEFKISMQVIFFLAGYIFVLIPVFRKTIDIFPSFDGFPFMIATFFYILTNAFVFGKKDKRSVFISTTVSLSAAVVISLIFNKIVLIPLP